MTTTLVVTAAPGPTSFNRAWAQASIDAARALGHEVLTSDLYAMGFDPAERGAHYGIDGPFDPLKAQAEAPTPPDAAAEAEKVRAADNVLFHFPIWWFSPPAILKGWTERVLLHGHLHDVPNRFDTGRLRLEARRVADQARQPQGPHPSTIDPGLLKTSRACRPSRR